MRGEQGEEKERREEWRVKREEQLTMTERDGEDSTKNKVFHFRFWLTAAQNLEWKMWV